MGKAKKEPAYTRGAYSSRIQDFSRAEIGEIHATFQALALDLLAIYTDMEKEGIETLLKVDGANTPEDAAAKMSSFADNAVGALREAVREKRKRAIAEQLAKPPTHVQPKKSP